VKDVCKIRLKLTVMSDWDLVEQLQNATSGLLWMSESDYPFEAFVWDIQGAANSLTPQQLRQHTRHAPDTPVETLEVDRFFARAIQVQNWHDEDQAQEVRQYQKLVKLLQESLEQIWVYRLGTIEIDIYIVGKTPSGNWAGLSTKAVET
jgi:Nuclease A inhibitor-like protein